MKDRSSQSRSLPAGALANLEDGMKLHQLGQFESAKGIYQLILSANPKNVDALQLLGTLYSQEKNYSEGVRLLKIALKINPLIPNAHNNLGSALRSLKKFDEALASYDKAISIAPDYAEAHNNRGNALLELKKFDEALASYDKAISIAPNFAEAFLQRGALKIELKIIEEGLLDLEIAAKLNPNDAEIYNHIGNGLLELRQFEIAIAMYSKATELDQSNPKYHCNLGALYERVNQLDAALISFENATSISQEFALAYYNAGLVQFKLRRFDDSIRNLEKAYELNSAMPYLQGALLHAKMYICNWTNLEQQSQEILEGLNSGKKTSAPFPLIPLTDSAEIQYTCAQIWANTYCAINNTLGPPGNCGSNSKIRIGYFSADFHNHATTYLISELFELHDKDKFEIYGFSFGPIIQDEMRQRVKSSFAQFFEVGNLTDPEIAKLAREMNLDIAIDLKGYTQDNRSGIFSYRAAPVQINYLGYPGTMGSSVFDYIVADYTLIPQDSQKYYSEKIIYMPNSYQINDRQRLISEAPVSRLRNNIPENAFVYCSFNNNYKITPEIFKSWMTILSTVPDSVLWLLGDNLLSQENLKKHAKELDVDPSRLIFAERLPLDEHLARHRLANLFLDTTPCNAHTTASDALWSGLPVLTQVGEAFASRVAASLLSAIGLPELITQTSQEYEAMAIHLATHPEALKNLKDKLEENRLSGPLFNSKKFTGHLEEAYEAAYARYVRGLNAENLMIGVE